MWAAYLSYSNRGKKVINQDTFQTHWLSIKEAGHRIADKAQLQASLAV